MKLTENKKDIIARNTDHRISYDREVSVFYSDSMIWSNQGIIVKWRISTDYRIENIYHDFNKE